MKNSFVYEYEMSTCAIYSTNSHLYKGVISALKRILGSDQHSKDLVKIWSSLPSWGWLRLSLLPLVIKRCKLLEKIPRVLISYS